MDHSRHEDALTTSIEMDAYCQQYGVLRHGNALIIAMSTFMLSRIETDQERRAYLEHGRDFMLKAIDAHDAADGIGTPVGTA